MSNFAVELIGTEIFTWSPPSEADEEGTVQLVDDCEYLALLPFSATPARSIKRCRATPLGPPYLLTGTVSFSADSS